MKITVIGGAGVVGSAAAFHIAASKLAEEVVLLGRRENVLLHHALDLSTAVSALGVEVRAGTYEDIGGSDLVINAAGVHQDITADRTQMLAENVALVREISRQILAHCPDAVVITATNPIDALNYATWRAGGLDPGRLIGYSLNDSLRFRERVAWIKGVEVDQVEGVVVGEHGFTQVPVFSSVRIEGRTTSFSEAEKESVRNEVPAFFKRIEDLKAGRTVGWTCAIGLAAMARAILHDTGEIFPASAILDGEYGQKGLSMGVPLRLGKTGVLGVVELDLAPDERTALEFSIERLRANAEIVDEKLC